jgi:tRNA threonylcarbamoyladenosine biosynthesis protein TsaB
MKILAIESSAGVASVALCEDTVCKYLAQDDSGNTHSKALLPMVITALEKHRLTVSDLDLVAVAAGPGSYTGVRIGVATVKGLLSGSGTPCMAVSSLEGLARSIDFFEGILCPVIDARRDRVYTALFESKKGQLTRLTEDAVLSFEELDRLLKSKGRVVYLVGNGYQKAKEKLGYEKIKETPCQLRLENAYGVAKAAYLAFVSDPGRGISEEGLLPVYALKTQAEREREERLLKEKEI